MLGVNKTLEKPKQCLEEHESIYSVEQAKQLLKSDQQQDKGICVTGNIWF